jgi:hypothetical protein
MVPRWRVTPTTPVSQEWARREHEPGVQIDDRVAARAVVGVLASKQPTGSVGQANDGVGWTLPIVTGQGWRLAHERRGCTGGRVERGE